MIGEYATLPTHLFAQLFPLSLQHFLVSRVDEHVGFRKPFSWRCRRILFYEPGKLRLKACHGMT